MEKKTQKTFVEEGFGFKVRLLCPAPDPLPIEENCRVVRPAPRLNQPVHKNKATGLS
jgi:hypothetical protein